MVWDGKDRRNNTELREIIETAVRKGGEAAANKAVQQTFLTLGIDISQPDSVKEVQQDFMHLRTRRQAHESISKTARKATVGVVVTTVVGGFIAGLMVFFRDYYESIRMIGK